MCFIGTLIPTQLDVGNIDSVQPGTHVIHKVFVSITPSIIWLFNTLRPKQNGRHFPEDILIDFFYWEFLNFDKDFIEVCIQGPN